MTEKTVWGIHGGATGDADTLFLKKNVVGVGWSRVGDLALLSPDREAIKVAVASAYPEVKPGAVPVGAGQLFRFAYEMAVGDIIVYPSKRDRRVHLGEVVGEYQFDPSLGGGDPSLDEGYPNIRPVRWLKELPRTAFTQGALYEIGSALGFFQVKNYAEEFRVALEGPAPPPVIEDDSSGYVVDEIVQATRDFILKRIARDLKGHPLAHFVAHLLRVLGYRTRVSPEGPDGGIDIVAHKDELGFEPPIVKVQVKSSSGNTGEPEVAALYGKVAKNEFGLLVSLGGFTAQAVNFARNQSNLRLIGGQELVDLVLSHYDELDPTYKRVVPLRQVFVPISATDQTE